MSGGMQHAFSEDLSQVCCLQLLFLLDTKFFDVAPKVAMITLSGCLLKLIVLHALLAGQLTHLPEKVKSAFGDEGGEVKEWLILRATWKVACVSF